MTARHRHLIAILLVLLHVLEPGLHLLQHAAGTWGDGSAPTTRCNHAACHGVQAAGSKALGVGVDANRHNDLDHTDECSLCAHLQRLHDYVAPNVGTPAIAWRATSASQCAQIAVTHTFRQSLPPARAPPPLLT